jgi:hypothetical protein
MTLFGGLGGRQVIIFTMIIWIPLVAACFPKTDEPLVLTLGYQGGLAPAARLSAAPWLIIPGNGGVFKLSEEEGHCRYAGLAPKDRDRILAYAESLWGSGLEGRFSVAKHITDLPSLMIWMRRGERTREISVYGYSHGKIEEKGGEYVDSIVGLAKSASTTKESWVPSEALLKALPWRGDTVGWRVYEWEGPDLPLDSQEVELSGELARATLQYLDGKTIYTRKDAALFRKGEKLYAISILPIIR